MLGLGLLLITAGAIVRFAVTATVPGINLRTLGVVLTVIGLITVGLSLLLPWTAVGGPGWQQ